MGSRRNSLKGIASLRKERIQQRRRQTKAASLGWDTAIEESIPQAVPQVKCQLKTPHYVDEMAALLGDKDEPYMGCLSQPEDYDTSQTQPTAEDRAIFQSFKPHYGSEEPTKKDTSVNPGTALHYGQQYVIDMWHRSSYPAEYTQRDYLTVCCYCLDYASSDIAAERHELKCHRRSPPGREIYRDGDLSFWEVDGTESRLYCQNLCLLAKCFLKSKALYRDVEPFFFYVLTKRTDGGPMFVGYFSKQKFYSYHKPAQPIQNVSCIVTLPFTQRSGFGQFLIEFSYLLTLKQLAVGSPETPISALGEQAFTSFWKRRICYAIKSHLERGTPCSITSLSQETGIIVSHVILALENLDWLQPGQIGKPILKINRQKLDHLLKVWESRNPLVLRPEKLLWTPLDPDEDG